MKKKLFIFLLTFVSNYAFSQDTIAFVSNNINRSSIDVGFGFSNANGNFTSGYSDKLINILTAEIGYRYMYSDYAGIKSIVSYSTFQNDASSPSFNTKYYDFELLSAINLGHILHMDDLHPRFGFILEMGLGLALMETNSKSYDKIGNVTAGGMFQYKLFDNMSFNLGGRFIYNFTQGAGFDGGPGAGDSHGDIFIGTMGISYYFGGNKNHHDWSPKHDPDYATLEDLDRRMQCIQAREYANKARLDSVMAVFDRVIDSLKISEPRATRVVYQKVVDEFVQKEYFNVYFDSNSYQVQTTSLKSLEFLKSFMIKNSDVNCVVIAHTDDKGSDEYNLELSKKRANHIVDLMVSLGIDRNRFIPKGQGKYIDDGKGDEQKRQLARKALFKFIKPSEQISTNIYGED